MSITYKHVPDPRIAERKKAGPPKTTDEHVGVNGRVALLVTTTVGTMWCAYVFALLAFIALPSALGGGILPLIQWISQTFIQLVMLSVIMVGQNILSLAPRQARRSSWCRRRRRPGSWPGLRAWSRRQFRRSIASHRALVTEPQAGSLSPLTSTDTRAHSGRTIASR